VFNSLWESTVNSQPRSPAQYFFFDFAEHFDDLKAHPADYGFVSDFGPIIGRHVANPDQYITWDNYGHPTTALHRVIAEAATFIPVTPGDYNRDGTVDTADYVVWRKGLGTTYTQADYDVWRANFGQTVGSGGALPSVDPLPAVPEPSTALVVFVGSLALAGGCRPTHDRRRRVSITFVRNPCRRSGSRRDP
jgi:hypothetical protein